MVSSLPCALCAVQNCNCLPHVRGNSLLSVPSSNRLCSCAAAADRNGEEIPASIARGDALITPPDNDPFPAVDAHERQRRRKKVNASSVTITTMSRERVANGGKLREKHSVRGFLNRRFKWRFWLLLPPRAKVTRPGGRNSFLAVAKAAGDVLY